jgi:hypothetical protein
MKYAYDAVTGEVYGLNRAGQEEEATGNCTPQELVYGMYAEKYTVVDGVLAPLSEEELVKLDIAKEKADAIANVPVLRFEAETRNLEYDGMFFYYKREDRTLLESAMEKIRRGVVGALRWKCANGYYELNADNIVGLEIAGLTQVQAAFIWEEAQVLMLTKVEEVVDEVQPDSPAAAEGTVVEGS